VTAARCTECGCTDECRCTESDGALCMWSPTEGLCTACEPRVAAQALAETMAEATVVGGDREPSAIDQLAREVLTLRAERDAARADLARLAIDRDGWMEATAINERQLAQAQATGDQVVAAAARTLAREGRWRAAALRFWAGRTAAIATLTAQVRAIKESVGDLGAFHPTDSLVGALVVTIDRQGKIEVGMGGDDGPAVAPLRGLAEVVMKAIESVRSLAASARREVARG